MNEPPITPTVDIPFENLSLFWWMYATRGGFAIAFAAVLSFTSALISLLIINAIIYVLIGVLIGFFVLGNGIILCVGTVFAAEHHRPIWRLILAESIFMLTFGVYVAFSLFISPTSVVLLAATLASITGCFVWALAMRLRHERRYAWLLGLSGLLTIGFAAFFLLHQGLSIKVTTAYLGGFEAAHGASFVILSIWLRGSADTSALATSRVSENVLDRIGTSDRRAV